MNPKRLFNGLTMIAMLGSLAGSARAALLRMEFAGGGNEVAVAPGDTVQVDLFWTMQATDTTKSLLTGVDLRFNVTSEPDPDGPERGDKFVVQSLTTPVPGWVTTASMGIGGPFSGGDFFLSAVHPNGTQGVVGDGTEFSTVIASFILHKADLQAGDTFVTFRHRFPGAVLPSASHGAADWSHQFQGAITGPNQFRMGQGNPGDAGPQWDPYHGYETFQPLIIHNVPEPSLFALVATGGLALLRRQRR